MAVIKSKKKTVIKKGANFVYVPGDFKQHMHDNFIEVDDPQIMLDTFGKEDFFVFDTETVPLDLNNNDIPSNIVRRWVGSGKKAAPQDIPFCISICNGKVAMSIYDTLENGFEKFKKLKPLFANTVIEKVAHNLKFDKHILANIGIKILGKQHDTVIISKLANENRKSFKLMDIVSRDKGEVKFEYMVDNYKKAHKITRYDMIPRELINQYANADVWNCWNVFVDEYPILEKDGLLDLYNTELELMLALWEMERIGMLTDASYEMPLKVELQKLCDEAEQSIYDTAGKVFNINSGQQIHKVLIDMGVDAGQFKYTEKGNPCMDKFELERLAKVLDVDLVEKILLFRKYDKLLGTYAIGIYSQADSAHRVHGSINQTEATTGRMSITKPALQTLPKKDKSIRKAFIPTPGNRLYFLDLDQVEYRLYAHYSKDPLLIQHIKDGVDVHTATAAILFNKSVDEVDKNTERPKAKTINFGLIYGMGVQALANDLGVSYDEAYNLKQAYFAALPNSEPFIRQVQSVIHLRGYIKNFFGRRRRLKSDECYKACNALIQGCAADYIKDKIVLIYKYIKYHNLKMKMINIVHDEVILDVPQEEWNLMPIIRWLLSDFSTFRVPITAGLEYGEPSWGQKVEPDGVGFTPVPEEELKKVKAVNLFELDIAA